VRQYKKIFIFVTHDPRIALLSDYRIIMKEGMVRQVYHTDEGEKRLALHVGKLDDALCELREKIRNGLRLSEDIALPEVAL